jgi:hypothetical protein
MHLPTAYVKRLPPPLGYRPNAEVVDMGGTYDVPEREVRRRHGPADTDKNEKQRINILNDVVGQSLGLTLPLLDTSGYNE